MVDKVASSKSGRGLGLVAPLPSRTGAGLLSRLVLRLWLGKTGGGKVSTPVGVRTAAYHASRCALASQCRGRSGSVWLLEVVWWVDDSVKLRSLSAACSTSAFGTMRPGAAPARVRAHLLLFTAVLP